MKRVLAIGALLLALTGCGTVENFTGRSHGYARPYGGTQIAVDRFSTPDDAELATKLPLWAADLPLSFVGDTLTLPITLTLIAWRACNLALFYDNTPPPSIVGRGDGFSSSKVGINEYYFPQNAEHSTQPAP
jgi:uncharacterized protein YceK